MSLSLFLLGSLVSVCIAPSSDDDLNLAMSRVFRTKSAFNRDRSVLGLIYGYEANQGLYRFFSEVKLLEPVTNMSIWLMSIDPSER